jgi:hypothetical protein
MTVTYGYYNSVDGDRVYNAIQMSQLFSSIISDGVLGDIGEVFHVAAGTGLQVTVDTGRAWFHNSWTDNDSILALTIATAHPTLPRIDRVIIEMNSGNGVRANSIKILQGTPASSPVAPTLTHTSEINQYTFANVAVAAGATQIVQGNITNKIGTTECPLVTGILETMTIDNIVAQWEYEFDYWLQTLIDELTENQAANLQNQITQANNTIIEEIVSTATPDEFVFDSIPGGFDMLRITGILKHTDTGGSYDDYTPTIRVNDDSGANYAYLALTTGQWSGWGSNTGINGIPVIKSKTKDAYFYTFFQLELPFYASPSMYKWIVSKGNYGAAPTMNPSMPGDYQIYRNIWRSASPITKVTITGQYVASVCKLRLMGCAF